MSKRPIDNRQMAGKVKIYGRKRKENDPIHVTVV